MNKIAIVSIAAILAFTGSSYAADLSVKAPPMVEPVAPSWTGFYLGLHAGAALGQNPSQSWNQTPDIGGTDPINFAGNRQWAALGGLQAGYNWQFAPTWVIGAEGDFSLTHLDQNNFQVMTSGGVPNPPGNVVPMNETSQWLASARGKLGYTWGPTLLYATGGAAWERQDYNGFARYADGSHMPGMFKSTNDGWVAGGGVEWMASAHVLLRAEYLYYGIQTGQTDFVPCMTAPGGCAGVGGSTYSWGNSNIQVLRAALSYKF